MAVLDQAAEIVSIADTLVDRLSNVCDNGNKLRDFSSEFSLSILNDLEAKLQLALSYVKTVTNSYSLINRIPLEILDTIFDLTIDRVPSFRPTLPRDPYYGTVQEFVWPYKGFAKATRVCRYWRAVTTQFAYNWNTIQIHSKSRRGELDKYTGQCMQFASLCLNRAAAAPLDIALHTKPSNAWLESNLLDQNHRFRTLVIDDVDVLPQLCHPAPCLKSLTIEPTWRTGGRRPPADIPQLFAGYAPSLRYLSIRYFVPWPANIFSELTHLCLQGDGTSAPYNFEQCLDFLTSTPKLQELVMAFVESMSQKDSTSIVSLSHLRRLVFYNCSDAVVSHTLSRLALPPGAILSIRFHRHGGWRPDRDLDYFSCLPDDISRVVDPLALRKFCLVHDDSHTNWVRFVGCGDNGSALDLYPGLVVGGLGRAVPTSNIMRLLAGCPIEELWTSPVRARSKLSAASLHPALDEQVWCSLFAAMPRLRRLVLGDWRRYGPDDDGCLPALMLPEVCPQLSELFLTGDWSPRMVTKLARERSAMGRPIQRVAFRRRSEGLGSGNSRGCGGGSRFSWSPSDLDELGQHVPQVEYVDFEDFSISLPGICFEERHAYWPSWKSQNTL